MWGVGGSAPSLLCKERLAEVSEGIREGESVTWVLLVPSHLHDRHCSLTMAVSHAWVLLSTASWNQSRLLRSNDCCPWLQRGRCLCPFGTKIQRPLFPPRKLHSSLLTQLGHGTKATRTSQDGIKILVNCSSSPLSIGDTFQDPQWMPEPAGST